MHGSRPRPHRIQLPAAVLLSLGALTAPASGQTPAAGPPPPLAIDAVVPERIHLEEAPPRAHLHLKGQFPPPTYHLLSRMTVWAYSGEHSCRLGWSRGPVEALLSRSGQPWLVRGDLLSEAENRERVQCGTIDGVWEDKLEITIVHPGLLTVGRLRVGVALHSVSEPGVSADESRGPETEAWIEIPVAEPFRVLAHVPASPVVAAGEPLRLSFAVTGGPPDGVEVAVGNGWHSIRFDVSGDRVSVQVPPTLYRAPTHLSLRLASDGTRVLVDVPVCRGAPRAVLACPTDRPPAP